MNIIVLGLGISNSGKKRKSFFTSFTTMIII